MTCQTCGRYYKARRYTAERGTSKFCSRECHQIALIKLLQSLDQNPEFRRNRITKGARRPNKAEKRLWNLLEQFFPGEWIYNTHMIGRVIPDFINAKGHKAVIEVAGHYWHTEEEMIDKAKVYAELGYKTLVLWHPTDFQNEGTVLEKVKAFLGN